MIKVLKTGFYSTIQDLGRFGYQQFGVPVSGVMDMYSAKLANVLLGNSENAAVLEITMTGPTLQFNCETVICISGADISPMLNGEVIVRNRRIFVHKGAIMSFGKLNSGFRCYLSVLGGFKTDIKLDSRSMYVGVTTQPTITKNDCIRIEESGALTKVNSALKLNYEHFYSGKLDVFKGPEFDLLSGDQKEMLFSQEFTISKDTNRMGYQLKEPLENSLKPIITSLVLPGTVQLTPSGRLIILMRDCQTTGGYPRILQLEKSAVDVVSQKFTDHKIRFNKIDFL